MMKLMKYLEWREEMAHGVGEVPRAEERHSRVWVPGRPGLLTVTGDRAGQDAVRMSFQPLGSSELFPDVPVWTLPTSGCLHSCSKGIQRTGTGGG